MGVSGRRRSAARWIANFDAGRRRLLAIAYRLTGSASEAEDLVQDAWLRWQRVDHDAVADPGAYLATAHASWGICNAPATGRMVAEMILDGESRSLDAAPFAVTRLPAGRILV